MGRNPSHVVRGVAAVIDSGSVTSTNKTVWVDSEDVGRALDQIQKLTGENYPEVSAFTHDGGSMDRVALAIE